MTSRKQPPSPDMTTQGMLTRGHACGRFHVSGLRESTLAIAEAEVILISITTIAEEPRQEKYMYMLSDWSRDRDGNGTYVHGNRTGSGSSFARPGREQDSCLREWAGVSE